MMGVEKNVSKDYQKQTTKNMRLAIVYPK